MPNVIKENHCANFEKCGEVFHRNGCFKLICTECHEKLFDFKEFVIHFEEVHCHLEECGEDFISTKLSVNGATSAKDNVFEMESFEAITLFSPDSSIDIKEHSSNEEKDALETKQIPVKGSQSETGTGRNKLALELRKSHTCEVCDRKFVSKKGLLRHNRRRHLEPAQYTCTQCSKTFTNKNSLWKHERETHIIFSCPTCQKAFKTRRSLKEHLQTHENTLNFPCQFEGCNKIYRNQRGLIDHNRYHNSKQDYVCEVCGYRTFRKYTLVAHIRTHTGEKPFPCKICGKHFVSQSMVNEHLATHAIERRHKCDICGATFTRQKALYHHKPLHLGIKKFVCSICDKSYAQRAGLSAHMRKHKIDGKIMPGLE